MTKNSVYGEILYMGLVTEKGRVYSELWKYNYRKALKIQVALWQRILRRMMDNKYTEEDVQLLKDFIELCKNRKEIGEYYRPQINSFSEIEQLINSGIEQSHNSKEDIVILNFMNDLVLELVELLKPKIFVNRNQVHLVIRALHNLPKYFLQNPQTDIYGLKNVATDFQNVIEYSFGNMDQSMKNRYIKYKIT